MIRLIAKTVGNVRKKLQNEIFEKLASKSSLTLVTIIHEDAFN